MRCEARTFDDIRALGGNSTADERCFAAVDRVSQTNLALYRTFMQPVVRALVNPRLADLMRQLHPLRLQYELFSNANPACAPLAGWAEQVREHRKPAAADNPFIAIQEGDLAANRGSARRVARIQRDPSGTRVHGDLRIESASGGGGC